MAGSVRILVLAEPEADLSWVTAAVASLGDAYFRRADDEESVRAALREQRFDVALCVAQQDRLPHFVRHARAGEIARSLIIVADEYEPLASEAVRLRASVCLRRLGPELLQHAVEVALRPSDSVVQSTRTAAFERGQREVLESIAGGKPLSVVLEQIVLLIEAQAQEMMCSILLVENGVVYHGAAPHLPPQFMASIEGAAIGPAAGSCGTAAYRRELVIVEDIGTHPYWADYRHLALPFGLRACWSSPIFSPSGTVLGTFAMYFHVPRSPSAEEMHWVDRATHLASIAICRELAQKALRESEARYRQIVDTAYEGVWLVDSRGCTLFVNERAAEMLGYRCEELMGRPMFGFIAEEDRARAELHWPVSEEKLRAQVEVRFRRRGGDLFWAIVAASPVRGERGRVVGVLGMITDITLLKRTELALRQSEAEFRTIFENAGIGIALVDAEGRPVRSNSALQRMLGYSEAELHELTFHELAHPYDVQPDGFSESPVVGTRERVLADRCYRKKDGGYVWARVTTSPVEPGSDGAVLGIVIVEDVTERKRLDEALRVGERLRSLIYNAVNDIIFYLAVEGPRKYRFVSANPAFLEATGLPEERVVGRMLEEVIPASSLEHVLSHYDRAIRERSTIQWLEVSQYPAGTKHGEVSITPVYDVHGRCTNLIGTVHDVTEHVVSRERIAEQAALLDRTKDAILVRDLNGVIQYWNRGAQRIYGWSSLEAVGCVVSKLIYKDPSDFDRAQQELFQAGEWVGEMAHVTRDGRQLIVEASWTLLRDGSGAAKAVLAINTDISEKKQLEMQMLRSQRLEELGAMAGGIAHDFNNIITAITANAGLAGMMLDANHPARQSLSEIEAAGARASDLARRILTFSRPELSERRRVKPDIVVNEALKLLKASLPSAIQLRTEFDPHVPAIIADPTQVHQVVMNLGTNAVHAMERDGGVLTIALQRAHVDIKRAISATNLREGPYARLVVSDTGTGMDDATLERAFDPFFTTKEPAKGTGLGLSVVHGIVKSHQGAIAVQSAPGVGTTFSVYFPAAEGSAAS